MNRLLRAFTATALFLIIFFFNLHPVQAGSAGEVADEEDPRELLTEGFRTWWQGSSGDRLPFAHFDGWADNMTTTNEYQYYYSMSVQEPRNRIENDTLSDGYESMSMSWSRLNSAIATSHDLINHIEVNGNAVVIDAVDQSKMMLSMAYLLRGLSQGYLASFFDQAYQITGTGIDSVFIPYQDVLEAALEDIDHAIELAEANSFQTFPFMSDVSMDNQELIQFANTFAAKFVISNGRSSDEYTQADWQRVVDYASNGYPDDLIIQGTGTSPAGWRHEYQRQSGLDWYWKSDMRIINLMDPDYPSRYPVRAAEDNFAIPEAQSDDARLELDFTYDPNNMHRFVINRGPQLQSVYYYTRYYELYYEYGFAPIHVFRKESVDMMLAEAYAHLGKTPQAIELINNGSRVNRGGLQPLPSDASVEEVLDAVYYEVEIDLQRTWVGYQYFLNRRRDILQAGTPLHLPVPAEEMELLGKPTYTFGGEDFTEEAGTADGSASWNKDWYPGKYDLWYDEVLAGPVKFEAAEVAAEQGDTVTIPISIEIGDREGRFMSFAMEYDADRLTVQGVSHTGNPGNWTTEETIYNGQAEFYMESTEAFTGSLSPFGIEAVVSDTSTGMIPIHLRDVKIDSLFTQPGVTDGAVRAVSLFGDANADGSLSIEDAELILAYLVGKEDLTARQKNNANVTTGSAVTAFDASAILMHLWGENNWYFPLSTMDGSSIAGVAFETPSISEDGYFEIPFGVTLSQETQSMEVGLYFKSEDIDIHSVATAKNDTTILSDYSVSGDSLHIAVASSVPGKFGGSQGVAFVLTGSILDESISTTLIEVARLRSNEGEVNTNLTTAEVPLVITSANDEEDSPLIYSISQNYPNPFNPVTRIEYSIPEEVHVSIQVYNAIGQRVQTLEQRVMPAGTHQVSFNGESLGSGVYFYKIQAADFQEVRVMTLIK